MTQNLPEVPATPPTPPFLLRDAGKTPWYIWLLALILGLFCALTLTSLATVGALLAAGGLLPLGYSILRRPILGFAFALAFFPFYTMLRGVAMVLHLPLPYALLGVSPEAILCLMAIHLVLRDIRAGKRRLRASDIPVALMLAGSLYALTLTVSLREWSAAAYGTHASITGFLFYFVGRSLEATREDIRLILRVWLVSFTILAAFSLWDYFYRPAFFIEVAIQVRDQFWKTWEPHAFFRWYPRMQSLLYGEQTWGTICAIVSVYCIALWGQQRALGPRRWIAPLYVLALVGLALSMSRGALVCWAVAMIILFLIPGKHRGLQIASAILGVAVLAFLVLRYSDHDIIRPLTDRVSALFDTGNRSAYDRVDQWKASLEVFPLFPSGRGLGRAGAMAVFHGTGDAFMAVPDGGYFKILAEGGIPGLALFIAGGFSFVFVLASHARALSRRDPGDYALALTVLSVMCGLLVQNIGGNLFDAYYATPLFFILSGLVTARRERGDRESGAA